jgi:hypothetical protein
MARKQRGRPKIVGKYKYYLHLGDRQNRNVIVKDTPTEVRRALAKFFEAMDGDARRYCTPEEYAGLRNVIMACDEIRDDDWDAGPVAFNWSFKWGGGSTMTVSAEVHRAPVEQEDVKVRDGLI